MVRKCTHASGQDLDPWGNGSCGTPKSPKTIVGLCRQRDRAKSPRSTLDRQRWTALTQTGDILVRIECPSLVFDGSNEHEIWSTNFEGAGYKALYIGETAECFSE